MKDWLRSLYDWFTASRVVSLLLDVSIAYSSWKLYVVLPMLIGSGPTCVFNALMMLAFGLTVHRVSRALGKHGRVAALVILYGLKFTTASVSSLAVYIPDIQAITAPQKQLRSVPTDIDYHVRFIKVENSTGTKLGNGKPSPRQIVEAVVFVWRSAPVDLVVGIAITWLGIVLGDLLALFLEWVHHKLDHPDKAQ